MFLRLIKRYILQTSGQSLKCLLVWKSTKYRYFRFKVFVHEQKIPWAHLPARETWKIYLSWSSNLKVGAKNALNSQWPGQATHQSKSCRRCSMSINLMNLNLPHHYCHSTWLSWLVMLDVIGVYQVLTINWNNLKDQAIEDHSSFRYVILAVYCMSHRVIILENLTARFYLKNSCFAKKRIKSVMTFVHKVAKHPGKKLAHNREQI